ncbi:hypothetical protein pneo_cds_364 [Pandoravirus neocaledonia]|uniref:DUF2283 domain-containing protein n=1 Tax=Pandoravirus neocaledonia TaxID=2107708 RepID=A0A2U7UBY2_9VIRU|nr:hypothetical protein pneo_cds_364 [Pandoravirus neocaledonia]AVK75971.1 hypothetical protein pneo_cds_364 [Pandoravirus neocaledonia]
MDFGPIWQHFGGAERTPLKEKQVPVMQAAEPQAQPSETKLEKWRDVELRYSGDVDIVVVYMTRAAPGLIAESVPLDYDEADLFMDVDDQNRVVAIEFLDASQIFACHFFDDALTLDDKEPLCMGCSCDVSSDELLLSFVETRRLGQKEHRLETDVIALVDARNRITGIRFTRASEVISKVD